MIVEITGLGAQKNKDKFNLFADGEFFSGVLKEVAIANNLFIGKKIEEKELRDIILQSEAKQAFGKASDYLAMRMHTSRELFNKLLAKGYSKQAINIAIERLKEYGYINDAQFAEQYVNLNTSLGRKAVANKLFAKGVAREAVAEATSAIDSDSEKMLATNLAHKYLRGKDPAQCRQKLYAFLARKGFEHEAIAAAIKAATGGDIDSEE